MKEQAIKTIELLKELYNKDNFHFSMNCAMIISGPHNKSLRQAIMETLTGQKIPATKCGLHVVSDAIKASKEQFSLF